MVDFFVESPPQVSLARHPTIKNHPKKERMVSMINIIKQEINIDKSLKQRLEFICEFTGTTPTFISGSIRKVDKTNLPYCRTSKVIIKNKISFRSVYKYI